MVYGKINLIIHIEIPAFTSGTLNDKVGEILQAAKYKVTTTTHASQTDVEDATTERVQQMMDNNQLDGCQLSKVDTTATTKHIVGQIMPQYSKSIQTSLGMTEDQYQNLMDDFDPPSDNVNVDPSEKGKLVEYSLNTPTDKGQYKSDNIPLVRAALIVDKQNLPADPIIQPVKIKPQMNYKTPLEGDNKLAPTSDIELTNLQKFRPGEAWRALGYPKDKPLPRRKNKAGR